MFFPISYLYMCNVPGSVTQTHMCDTNPMSKVVTQTPTEVMTFHSLNYCGPADYHP